MGSTRAIFLSSNRSMRTARRCSLLGPAAVPHHPVSDAMQSPGKVGRARRARSIAAIALAMFASLAWSQGQRIPADAVDAFHDALKKMDTAAALSLLDRELVV